jgi:hypothetical protein
MAATLTEEGRAPAVQEFTRAEFERFVKSCLEPPIPIPKLRELLRSNFAGGSAPAPD